jgi:hypothetical protein
MDGPQGNSIIRGIFLWFKTWIDPILLYFKQWSIDTATSAHLTLMGILSGIPRPYSFSYDDPLWYIWLRGAELSTVSLYGLSSTYDTSSGGLLSEETEGLATTKNRLLAEYYRPILKAACTSGYNVGGLLLIDKLASLFFDPEEYEIGWLTTGQPGDIFINISSEDQISVLTLLSLGYLWEPNTHIIVTLVGG